MAFTEWLALNWFDFSQTLALLGGLVVALYTIRTDRNSRIVANNFEITKQHRELWLHYTSRPALKRIFKKTSDSKPTDLETTFVTLLILHLKAVYNARKHGAIKSSEGIHNDIRSFFACEIPLQVWEERKVYYDSEFVRFVESNLRLK